MMPDVETARPDPDGLVARVHAFAADLRLAGTPLGPNDESAALEALAVSDLTSVESIRSALRATLITRAQERGIFDILFRLHFATPRTDAPASLGALDDDELRALLADTLLDADESATRMLGIEAARRWSGFELGRPVAGTYYVAKALGRMDLDGLVATALGRCLAEREPHAGWERLRVDHTIRTNALRLERAIDEAVRSLVVADRGARLVARSLRPVLPEDADLTNANDATMRQVEQVMPTVVRALNDKLRRRYRAPGRLDVARTLRRAVSYGGTPIDSVFRRRRTPRREIIVMADVSGSVAAFAGFTLRFVSTLARTTTRVRAYAFIEDFMDVTDIARAAGGVNDLVTRIDKSAETVRADGHSDYGYVFERFARDLRRTLRPSQTLLVLGDGRNNFRSAHLNAFAEMTAAVGQTYWLNPEPRSDWGNGDSAMYEYSTLCTGVATCRTLNDLRRFVEEVAG